MRTGEKVEGSSCGHLQSEKATKDFAAAKSKDKTRVSVRSQKQEGGFMCIVV